MLGFTTPTEDQLDQWEKIATRTPLYALSLVRQGNFTIATAKLDNEEIVVGVAKMNPTADEDIPERGEAIAMAIAARMANGGVRNASA